MPLFTYLLLTTFQLLDSELLTPELIFSVDSGSGVDSDGDADQGATQTSSNMPGIANPVQTKKNAIQPICSTIAPVVALARLRGKAASAVNNAN